MHDVKESMCEKLCENVEVEVLDPLIESPLFEKEKELINVKNGIEKGNMENDDILYDSLTYEYV